MSLLTAPLLFFIRILRLKNENYTRHLRPEVHVGGRWSHVGLFRQQPGKLVNKKEGKKWRRRRAILCSSGCHLFRLQLLHFDPEAKGAGLDFFAIGRYSQTSKRSRIHRCCCCYPSPRPLPNVFPKSNRQSSSSFSVAAAADLTATRSLSLSSCTPLLQELFIAGSHTNLRVHCRSAHPFAPFVLLLALICECICAAAAASTASVLSDCSPKTISLWEQLAVSHSPLYIPISAGKHCDDGRGKAESSQRGWCSFQQKLLHKGVVIQMDCFC